MDDTKHRADDREGSVIGPAAAALLMALGAAAMIGGAIVALIRLVIDI